MKPFVTGELWAIAAPPVPEGRPALGVDGRTTRTASCNGILYVLRGGNPWRMRPTEPGYGSRVTGWRRLREWWHRGVRQRLQRAALERLAAQPTSSTGRGRPWTRGARPRTGGDTGLNPTDKGKPGSKHHLLVGLRSARSPSR